MSSSAIPVCLGANSTVTVQNVCGGDWHTFCTLNSLPEASFASNCGLPTGEGPGFVTCIGHGSDRVPTAVGENHMEYLPATNAGGGGGGGRYEGTLGP